MSYLPKISVITAVKNGGKTFEKSIQSLIAQDYPNLEYIVIDGASTDNTLEIIKKYEKHINFWRSSDDRNNVIAHIEGLKQASGDIIAFLSCDDFYEAETLKKAGAEFAQNPNLDIVSFLYRSLKENDDGSYKIIDQSTISRVELSKNKIIESYGINARFFKKKLFENVLTTHDDQGRAFVSNDIEYMIRFVLNGAQNKTINYVGYNYLIHEDSLTFSNNIDKKNRLYEDKIFVAKKFLNSNEFILPKIWLKTFKKWIKKYRAMLVISYFKHGKFRLARKEFSKGISDNNPFAFIFYCLKTFFRKSF